MDQYRALYILSRVTSPSEVFKLSEIGINIRDSSSYFSGFLEKCKFTLPLAEKMNSFCSSSEN